MRVDPGRFVGASSWRSFDMKGGWGLTGLVTQEDAVRSSGNAVLELAGVRVWTAGGAQLLRGIEWTVDAGEHWALLGPNGAGKSTLLSVASGLRFPSGGEVSLFGGQFGRVEIRPLRAKVGI